MDRRSMQRATVMILSSFVAVAMLVNPVSAGSFTVRTDPNDTPRSDGPDIRKVLSDLSPTGVVFRIGTWDRLKNTDVSFSVILDTRGSTDYDRIIEISTIHPRGCTVEELEDGFLGDLIGQRATHRVNQRTISCRIPTGWLAADKVVRFRVLTGIAGDRHHDRAPNHGRFIGL